VTAAREPDAPASPAGAGDDPTGASDGGARAAASGGTPSVRAGWVLFAVLATLVVAADQLTKAWVDAAFSLASPHAEPGAPGGPTRVLGDLVRISKVYNDGGIFGLLGASAPVLGLASLVVIGGILWYQARHGPAAGRLVSGSLGLLLGGALGNLIDRLRFGHVIDWVDTGLGSMRWYTFNVADAAIFVSLVVLVGTGLLGDRLAAWRRPADRGRRTA
jgi:signal peptidase II